MTAARDEAEPEHDLVELAARLSLAEHRAAAADALAAAVGGESLIVFIRDAEVNALLPAPGFPQTLPDGRAWRAFLTACIERGEHRGELTLTAGAPPRPAIGYASGRDSALVLVGAGVSAARVHSLRSLLPLMAAAFRGDQIATIASAQAEIAKESETRAAALMQVLDRTRHRLEAALADSRAARSELEHLNTALQDQATELEMVNEQLREQTVAMEEQTTELHARAIELEDANRALEVARAVAEKANHAKSEFLATMSHELRTPLNAIGGHVQLLALGIRGPITDEQRDALTRIDRSQRHLLGLINDILNLSRIEAGRVDYRITDVALSDAVKDLTPMIEPQLAAKSLAFEIRSLDQMPVVRADREKLQQILLNLLSNAVKFTDSGGRVWIHTGLRSDEPGKVFIHVSDSGRGIPADKSEVIFEPFTQVDPSRIRESQGTGLGLAISRDLARGMGGDLLVRSEFGVGSTFTLSLDAGSTASLTMPRAPRTAARPAVNLESRSDPRPSPIP